MTIINDVNWSSVILVVLIVIVIGVVCYWQLFIAEGAYLGAKVVAKLYDWFAVHYDRVKEYDANYEAVKLAQPILQHIRLHGLKSPQILDIGTGTGRLPIALFRQSQFNGLITAIDLSPRMLALAQQQLHAYADRMTFLLRNAQVLPFATAHFDVVTCLEAIEFFADPNGALQEMYRVLRPGGFLLISNRIGPDAWKMPGRVQPSAKLAEKLQQMGFAQIAVDAWFIDYDLVRAIKI
jgi:ubiquinone/menaquinone biosynthesis C-methylase UbiE